MMLIILCLIRIVLTDMMVLMANSWEIPAESKDFGLRGWSSLSLSKRCF